MDKIRAFIALNLDIEVINKIVKVEQVLKQKCEEANFDIRWVPPPNIHLTLKFLGDIERYLAEAIRDQLSPHLSKISPLKLQAKGLGAFPSLLHPKVIWMGCQDISGGLKDLVEVIEFRLEEMGFPLEKRQFMPHITLGRVKRGPKGGLEKIFKEIGTPDCGLSKIYEVVVYRSDLKPSGAEYVSLVRILLKERRKEP
jgi:2'-5' RNA ligase